MLEVTKLIEIGKSQGRDVWVEKNSILLKRYEEILSVLKNGKHATMLENQAERWSERSEAMNHKRNSAGIISHSKEKRNKSIKAADDAIRRLLFDKQDVNFNTVAKTAGVSKTFLYSNEDLRKRIEDLRDKQAQTEKPNHLKQRMSDASKDALIAAKNKRIADLEAENKKLKAVLSKKLGEEYDNL